MNKRHWRHYPILIIILCAVLTTALLAGCSAFDLLPVTDPVTGETVSETADGSEMSDKSNTAEESEMTDGPESIEEPETVDKSETSTSDTAIGNYYDFSNFLEEIQEWTGFSFTYVNNNRPDFDEDEIWDTIRESLDPLDDLGRCGTATSCIGREGMPTEPRGDISSIEPTGWHTDRYGFVQGESLYNRCHLIGHQLSGDDAIPRNLITGTSYMNRDGMLPFENAIAAYVKGTGNHVMYRVTPVFSGDELLCRGVHMEAMSVEDEGAGLSFNVFCYNVQPGIDIDYSTGKNSLSEDHAILEDYEAGKYSIIPDTHGTVPGASDDAADQDSVNQDNSEAEMRLYVLNTNTGRFHYPNCRSVKDMAEHNKQEEETTRDDLINRGYKPCGNCKP